MHLLEIGEHVAMGKHRPLWHAGRSSGILEEGEVVRPQTRKLRRVRSPESERAVEAHRLGQIPGRNRVADMTQREIDDQPARRAWPARSKPAAPPLIRLLKPQ